MEVRWWREGKKQLNTPRPAPPTPQLPRRNSRCGVTGELCTERRWAPHDVDAATGAAANDGARVSGAAAAAAGRGARDGRTGGAACDGKQQRGAVHRQVRRLARGAA